MYLMGNEEIQPTIDKENVLLATQAQEA